MIPVAERLWCNGIPVNQRRVRFQVPYPCQFFLTPSQCKNVQTLFLVGCSFFSSFHTHTHTIWSDQPPQTHIHATHMAARLSLRPVSTTRASQKGTRGGTQRVKDSSRGKQGYNSESTRSAWGSVQDLCKDHGQRVQSAHCTRGTMGNQAHLLQSHDLLHHSL